MKRSTPVRDTPSLVSGLRVKVASVTYFPPSEKGSTARIGRIGRSERGLRRERRKGLDEGGKAWW
jgi:hypothetical protein